MMENTKQVDGAEVAKHNSREKVCLHHPDQAFRCHVFGFFAQYIPRRASGLLYMVLLVFVASSTIAKKALI